MFRPLDLAAARIGRTPDEFHVIWPTPTGTHRLISEAADGEACFHAVILPVGDEFDTRLDAARRFWRALNDRPSGPVYGALPRQSMLRHVLNLRVHDGRRAGATQRQIAEALLIDEPIISREWRDHPLRHKVGAILGRADRLVDGGYRDLLFYPRKAVR